MSPQRKALLSALLLLVSSGSPATVEPPDGSSPGDITPGPISGMDFAHIPSGFFQMGPADGDPDSYDNEHPVHTLTFDYTFEMMTTEVTQAMWEKVIGYSSCYFSGASLPMHSVSWNNCQEFVDSMNVLDPTHVYRLPTESEWEYCCRAGTTTRFYWGDDPGCTLIDSYAWYGDNSGGEVHPVGQKLPNAWGLYDMSGNVYEMCEDWYHNDYDGAPADGSPWLEPSGSSRVSRGGSWFGEARFCRSSNRLFRYQGRGQGNCLGLRLVRLPR